MPALVAGIHVLPYSSSEEARRGWPGRSPAMTMLREALRPSLRLDVRRLDDRPPLRGLGLVPGTERFGRKLTTLGNFEAEIDEPLLHGRIGERLDHRRVDPRDRLLRRALRHPEAVPQRHVEARQASLVHGWNIGRGRQPLAVGDRIRADVAGADL